MKTTRQLLSEVANKEIPEDWAITPEDMAALFPDAFNSWFHTVGNGAGQRQFFVTDKGEVGYNDNSDSKQAYFWRNNTWTVAWIHPWKWPIS